MLPSLTSLCAMGLALVSASQASGAYRVAERYLPNDFMDESKWAWRTSKEFAHGDPTGGYIDYVSLDMAKSKGLARIQDGAFHMQVETNRDSFASAPPQSIRIESKANWKTFLAVAKFRKFPIQGCGLWPAYWTNGRGPWPQSGETNMYEAWNLDPFNRPALHTGNKAEVGELILEQPFMTGKLARGDCDNVAGPNKDIGCVVHDHGAPYLSQDGGVYAVQLESDVLRMWKWAHGSAPVDINDPNPNPDTWGMPFLSTPAGKSLEKLFKNQQIIINLDVCGGAPEATWAVSEAGEQMCSVKTGYPTCKEYIKSVNGSAFEGFSFQIEGITVWTADNQPSPVSSPAVSLTPISTVTIYSTTTVPYTHARVVRAVSDKTTKATPTSAVQSTTSKATLTSAVQPTTTRKVGPTTDTGNSKSTAHATVVVKVNSGSSKLLMASVGGYIAAIVAITVVFGAF